MTERWLPVLGYEGRYEVSDHGCVRSCGIGPGGKFRNVLRPYAAGEYPRVALHSAQKEQRTTCVHEIVLSAFAGPRPHGMVCRHLNGDPRDNRLTNLRWGTPAENNQDMVRHGRSLRGTRNPNAILDESSVREMRRLRAEGWTLRRLVETFGLRSESHASQIVRGLCWAHVSEAGA